MCRLASPLLKSSPFLTKLLSLPSLEFCLLKSLLGKGRQHKASLVDLGVVVPALGLLLLGGPRAERDLDIAAGVLAADHEADLARGVGGNGGVSVLGDGEHLLAVLLEAGDQGQVKPLVLS